jgi:hypothetical protein
MSILAHGYLLVILLWSPYVDSHLFSKSWHDDKYNCSNTCLYALWSTLILILMHSISFFSSLCLMSSLPKGESICTKLVELFANRVVERRNMINDYLRGRACIESVRGSWFQGECWFWAFMLTLSFSCPSELFFSSSLQFCVALPLFLSFVGSLLIDDLLEFFWLFGSSNCAS